MKVYFSVIICAVCLLATASQVFAKNTQDVWPTKEFEVIWSQSEELPQEPPDRAIVESWEDFYEVSLRKISNYYADNGISPPSLKDVPGDDGVQRFQVYVYPSRSSGTGQVVLGYFEYTGCLKFNEKARPGIFSNKLNLNIFEYRRKSANDTPENVKKALYFTMAHELFHAIQYTYDKKYGSVLWCNKVDPPTSIGREAVLEGTAVAAGALATEKEYPGYIDGLNWADEALGAFPYGSDPEFLKANFPERKLEHKTSSFWRYLAERFGGPKVFDILFRVKLTEASVPARYEWLNTATKEITGKGSENSEKDLYILFPEFQAEFASYVDDRYKGTVDESGSIGSRKRWVNQIYSSNVDCPGVELKASKFYGEVNFDGASNMIQRNGARCINISWDGMDPNDEIWVEAMHSEATILDQLHLGVSYLDTAGKQDSCFKNIVKQVGAGTESRRLLECSFGKLFIKSSDDGRNTKLWMLGTEGRRYAGRDFFERKPGSSGNATLILTNMATAPGTTKSIPSAGGNLIVRFSLSSSRFTDGRKVTAPVQIQLRDPAGVIGNIPIFGEKSKTSLSNLTPFDYRGRIRFIKPVFGTGQPKIDRYSIYGIKKPAKALPNGMGASFQVETIDDPKKKYTIAPLDPAYKFEATGKMMAEVSNEEAATSTICFVKTGRPKKVMEVTQSDDDQLRFSIKADLCKMLPNGEIKKVDRIDAKFVYAFGRRAYPDKAAQDVITPGLELYIDQYLRELVRRGVPLPATVLMSDGSVPGDEDGDGTPDYNPTNDPTDDPTGNPTGDPTGDPNNKDNKNTTVEVGPCKCTCEEYARIKKLAEDARRDPSKLRKMRSLLVCARICAREYSKCPK